MKILFLPLLLALPSLAHASLVAPESTHGRKIVHHLAEEVSRTFVNQAESMKGNEDADRASCEAARSSLLEQFAILELSGSKELTAAKNALEKAECSSEAQGVETMGPPVGATDIRQANDHFFAATVFLRSVDSRE